MRARAIVLAAAIVMAPFSTRAADLVVWWDEGYYAEESEAVRETIAAYEQETGKQVELVFHPEGEHPERWRPGSPPTSPSVSVLATTFPNGPLTIGSWSCRAPLATFRIVRSGRACLVQAAKREPKPFVWTADPDRIVEKVRRGYHALASMERRAG